MGLACDSKENSSEGIATTTIDEFVDGDGDGLVEDDCNDSDASVNPGAVELCDGIDND